MNSYKDMPGASELCDVCYRIACKQCGWVASQSEVLLIQKQVLTSCPQCGWQPQKPIDL